MKQSKKNENGTFFQLTEKNLTSDLQLNVMFDGIEIFVSRLNIEQSNFYGGPTSKKRSYHIASPQKYSLLKIQKPTITCILFNSYYFITGKSLTGKLKKNFQPLKVTLKICQIG